MLLRQFIIEQTKLNKVRSEGDFTIKELSDKDWADWVEQHCSDYLPRAGRYPIYRGFKNEIIELGVKNTNEFTRQSAGGVPNYYTLWMDNAPQWKGYPKRSKSFISSSNFRTAQGFGIAHQLFPADDAKIGICPSNDIWDSFGKVPGGNMDRFAFLLKTTFKKIYGESVAKRAMVDWAKFKQLLELTAFSKFLKINKIYDAYDQLAQSYPKLIDYFEGEIVPLKHGFQRATPANYSVVGAEDKEVWVQGKVALLNVNFIFDDDSKHLFPRTTALLSKYNVRKPY